MVANYRLIQLIRLRPNLPTLRLTLVRPCAQSNFRGRIRTLPIKLRRPLRESQFATLKRVLLGGDFPICLRHRLGAIRARYRLTFAIVH